MQKDSKATKKAKKPGVLAKPAYMPAFDRKKTITLCRVDDEKKIIVTESRDGRRVFFYHDMPSFLQCAATIAGENAYPLFFISRLATFSLKIDFIRAGDVMLHEETPTSARALVRSPDGKIRGGLCVVQSLSFGYDIASDAMLEDLRLLYDFLGIGVFSSIGALAQAYYCYEQYQKYAGAWRDHRHIRPGSNALEFLEANKRGGRRETFADPAIKYLYVDELDICMAHPDAYRIQGAGKSYYSEVDKATMPYYEAVFEVTLPHDYPYALVKVNEIDGVRFDEDLQDIQQAGTYRIPIIKAERDLLDRAGCTCTWIHGFYWKATTDDSGVFTARMEQLRNDAPNEMIQNFVKQIAVAGPGRDGMNEEMFFLVTEEQRKKGDTPLSDDTGCYDLFIQKRIDPRPQGQLHWHNNTSGKVRCTITELMFTFQGEVLQTDIDNILVSSTERSRSYPLKEGRQFVAGEIVRKEHTGVTFSHKGLPANGHMDADLGKHKHPGVSQKRRKDLA